ncbi:MAG: phosphodiester glycosidase family protein [Armatimonadota bacterium]
MRFPSLLSPLAASLFLIGAVPFSASAQPAPTPANSVKPLAKGVRLLQTVIPEGAVGGPLMITTVEVNPKAAKGVRVGAALGGDIVWGTDPTLGRENVSALTARTGAVAGINASFFPFAGNPLGFHVQQGEMVIEPAGDNAVFYIEKNGTPRFDALTYRGIVSREGAGTDTYAIGGLNRAPAAASANKSEIVLYTPIFFNATLPSKGRFEVALRVSPGLPLQAGKPITGMVLRTGEDGRLPIEKGTVVLSGSGDGADYLRRVAGTAGAKVTVRLDLETVGGKPFDLSRVREAVAGRHRLIKNGKVVADTAAEGAGGSFSTTLHPRSAVGVTADGKILLVLVDGRQKGISRGIGLVELAQRMQSMGCVDALNLDGGGSSALSVGGLIVNSPSGNVERPVASMLLVYAPPLDSKSRPAQVSLAAPATRTVQVGETLPVVASPLAPKMVLGSRDGIGYVTQADGQFHATRPGKGIVGIVMPGAKQPVQTMAITVVGKDAGNKEGFTPKLTLTPEAGNENRATLTIKIANYEGDALGSAAVTVSVVGGRADAATVTTDGKGTAQVGITWDAGSAPGSRSVTVSSAGGRFGTVTVK